MNVETERIPLDVDVKRIIEVLATQIYQSPLALLRENTQNAFDAVLMRLHGGDAFEPEIAIQITPSEIRVSDNGLGMKYAEVRDNFWRAGASSKNTPEARAAGVVGTFGIGAMANFGIASHLRVVTESAVSGERTETSADGASLSTHENCIEITAQLPQSDPGTQVRASINDSNRVDVARAVTYIAQFVRHVSVPVIVNGAVVSQQPLDSQWPEPQAVWTHDGNMHLVGDLSATAHARAAANGQLWVEVAEIHQNGTILEGRIILSQGGGQLQTLRSGFGLATAAVTSVYGFGGAIDLPTLQPTAGREALSTSSMELLQAIILNVEAWVSEHFGNQPISHENVQFIEWARRNRRPDLCGALRLRQVPPDGSITLAEVRDRRSAHAAHFYAGTDEQVIRAFASEENPLLVGSLRNPRRACEQAFLNQYCQIEPVPEGPSLLRLYTASALAIDQLAILHRITDTLERDYFLPANVVLAEISHRVPALVIDVEPAVRIALDPSGQSFGVLRELYTNEYAAFGSFAKDFVRTVVFPLVEKHVPSSTREGAAAFLSRIRSKRDLFEYELADRQELGSIWEDYQRGDITFEEATKLSRVAMSGSVQLVRDAAQVADIAPDLVSNLEQLPEAPVDQPLPAIQRPEVITSASLLTIDGNRPALNGFRCFLALSDRVMKDKGSFFLQPHRTTVVWGGQKVLFVFQHHSDEFGLYYDIQIDELVSHESGGGGYLTSTLMLGTRVFIPIPERIHSSFVPEPGATKRLEVRAEMLHTRGGDSYVADA